MLKTKLMSRFIVSALMGTLLAHAQGAPTVDVRMQLQTSAETGRHSAPSAVFWLKPLQQTPEAPFVPDHHYTLLQKNRKFTPHLLVIPVGSTVNFPNADPFFHNVFSLFDGKRFDLGLYEAGSTKAVTFPREGISYIFCNIHPEMSAVVLTLSTSLYGIADSSGSFHLSAVPAGDYELHVWIEGVAQPALSQLTRRVHIAAGSGNLGVLTVPALVHDSTHTNMFGQPYDRETKPTY
jgi:plastocyanin